MTWRDRETRLNWRDDTLDAVTTREARPKTRRTRTASIMSGWAASGDTFESYASRVLRVPASRIAVLMADVGVR